MYDVGAWVGRECEDSYVYKSCWKMHFRACRNMNQTGVALSSLMSCSPRIEELLFDAVIVPDPFICWGQCLATREVQTNWHLCSCELLLLGTKGEGWGRRGYNTVWCQCSPTVLYKGTNTSRVSPRGATVTTHEPEVSQCTPGGRGQSSGPVLLELLAEPQHMPGGW